VWPNIIPLISRMQFDVNKNPGGAGGTWLTPITSLSERAGHGVVIVENEENDRHAEAPVARNFIGELRPARPIERFQKPRPLQ